MFLVSNKTIQHPLRILNNLFVLTVWTHTRSGHDGKNGEWAWALHCRLLTKTDQVNTIAGRHRDKHSARIPLSRMINSCLVWENDSGIHV